MLQISVPFPFSHFFFYVFLIKLQLLDFWPLHIFQFSFYFATIVIHMSSIQHIARNGKEVQLLNVSNKATESSLPRDIPQRTVCSFSFLFVPFPRKCPLKHIDFHTRQDPLTEATAEDSLEQI